MRVPPVVCLDFETHPIIEGSHKAPEPVSVSIQVPGDRKPKFWAWGHEAGGNNCSKEDGRRRVMEAWTRPERKLFFNAKFDIKVAMQHFDCPELPWEEVDDAMFLLFLDDPHQRSMQLKPASARILGLPPEEQDAVRQWLVDHKIVTARDGKWGRFIWKAPGTIVGPYANGDVIRTKGMFAKLLPEIAERGMLEAYDRERRLLPIFIRNEAEGIRVDVAGLERDIPIHEKNMERVDEWLRKKLNRPGLNIDADVDMGDALNDNGIITDWVLTPTGQRSVAKKNLRPAMYKDKNIFAMYGYRNRLATCLRMFEKKWLDEARENDGYIHCNWNQVRQPKGGGESLGGTRSGRPSADNPNLLNLSKTWFDGPGALGYFHPKVIKLPDLPFVRQYMLPDKYGRQEGVFLHRDFSQQELKLLAHFEEGDLFRKYTEDPDIDIHEFVRQLLIDEGYPYERRKVKTLNFGLIYGKGAGLFAEELEITVQEARDLMKAHKAVLPGVADVFQSIKDLVKEGKPIRTWGGREYFVEEPMLIKGRMVTWEYKLVNYLCQASAADVTKEVLIRYDEARKESRFLTTVYDEINITAPKGAAKQEMKILRDAMESIELDLPLTTDGKSGPNWAALTKYAEPKFDIAGWRRGRPDLLSNSKEFIA